MAIRRSPFTRDSAMAAFKDMSLEALKRGEWFGREDIAKASSNGTLPSPEWFRTYCGTLTNMRRELGLPSSYKQYLKEQQLASPEYQNSLSHLAQLLEGGHVTMRRWEEERKDEHLNYHRLTKAYGKWGQVLSKARETAKQG